MIRFLSLLGFVAGGMIIGAIFGFAAAVSFNPLASLLYVLCGGVAGGIGGFVLGKFFLFLMRLVFRILFGAALGWVLGWGLSLIWLGAPSTLPLWFAVAGAIYFLIRHHHAKSPRNSASSASFMDSGSTLTTGSGNTCRVRQGDSSSGRVLLTIDGDRVRRGDASYGDVVMRFDGNKVRRGDASYGAVIASLDGQKVRQGDASYGKVIATLDGQKVRQGDSTYGTVIATTEGGYMSGAAAAAFLLLS